jgi:hypothetical protein
VTFTTPGKIAVPTPGTPVRLTTDATITCHQIVFSPVPGNTGNVHIKYGRSLAAPVIMRSFLPAPASGFIDEHCIATDMTNPLYPADFYVDAAVATEGLNVYWVAE